MISKTALQTKMSEETEESRRAFLSATAGGVGLGLAALLEQPPPASAVVYLDPAMYGDQENRVAAVDSTREAVRRAILQNPSLAPTFYILAVMDGLSYDYKTKEFGPDGRIVRQVLESDSKSPLVASMKEACLVLIESKKALKKYTAVTIADSVALAGAEAVESIGGPVLSIQLGRTDAAKTLPLSPLPLDLLSDSTPPQDIIAAFRRSGLTEREMTAILGVLLTIIKVNQDKLPGDWKKSNRGKFVERGKMGRMSDFKRLTDQDIADMESDEENETLLEGDEDWYIGESFGARADVFGKRASEEIDTKTFNKILKGLNEATIKKGGKGQASKEEFGFVGQTLLSPDSPTSQAWLAKYAAGNLIFLKDIGIAFNQVTQLGGEFTGGKYDALLRDKPRKTLLND
eukprot:CAMPEP_0195535404 /NCGR_PEP_ID=MMETSP0794_2-20130614/44199_1 /TAXON_ID=515487 /ORGANISM="Stephanopyxis turris, Strain CCMP 815" /LENGTH=402 /DNA_ID=CAMNT_0040668531 /DNA_START=129 /DNA_END=1337 /DNA_ORIENTATION=-